MTVFLTFVSKKDWKIQRRFLWSKFYNNNNKKMMDKGHMDLGRGYARKTRIEFTSFFFFCCCLSMVTRESYSSLWFNLGACLVRLLFFIYSSCIGFWILFLFLLLFSFIHNLCCQRVNLFWSGSFINSWFYQKQIILSDGIIIKIATSLIFIFRVVPYTNYVILPFIFQIELFR